MAADSFERFYELAHGRAVVPYPYQATLASTLPETEFLIAPTGLGKTAAVTLAWAFDWLSATPRLPRRLVWCLPMRTLVEQTAKVATTWMSNLTGAYTAAGRPIPAVHVLMGGTVNQDWRLAPELPAVLVGTQDMLLSRALMRGYGMSRFGWPIDFGLLHTDALWIFDEVQLMGTGLATSAQLEGFRQRASSRAATAADSGAPKPARSLWMSATLDPTWLQTAEFRPGAAGRRVLRWDDGQPPEPPGLTARLDAGKPLRRAAVVLGAEKAQKREDYARALATEVASTHRAGTTTLVVVNTVGRAQKVYAALADAAPGVDRLLVHSRFRPQDRRRLDTALTGDAPTGRIVVATQAVEAGVDLTSAALFTELAPWSSLVQRFGRCNRGGERNALGGAKVFWVDVDLDADAELARPYLPSSLLAARSVLADLVEVSPRRLPPPSPPPPFTQVIRPKDLEELFDTDADLSGHDVDISPYIRDGDDVAVSLFWRDLTSCPAGEQGGATRDELCSGPVGAVRMWLKKHAASAFVEAPNAAGKKIGNGTNRWTELGDAKRIRPGMVVMVDARLGGYSSAVGFDPAYADTVLDVSGDGVRRTDETAPGAKTDEDDPSRALRRAVLLVDHLDNVAREAAALARLVGLEGGDVARLERAGGWHDVGKAHAEFRRRMGVSSDDPPLAKSLHYKSQGGTRPYFRHELASALAFLQQHDGDPDADLIAFLVAAHHGKVRMGIRALPNERAVPPARRIARGVQEGDALPEVAWANETSAALLLDLEPMHMGESADSRASWTTRTQELLRRRGPFELAFFEALLRMADWRASAAEQQEGGRHG